jgi:hypothetical protein
LEKELGQPIVTGFGIELNERETFASPARKAVMKPENALDTFSGVKTRYLTKFNELSQKVPGPFVDNREQDRYKVKVSEMLKKTEHHQTVFENFGAGAITDRTKLPNYKITSLSPLRFANED